VTVAARPIHVEFSYAGAADGFRLYQNGVQVCEITDGTARTIVCNVTISQQDVYTLTAFTTTTESQPSPPYKVYRTRALYRRIRGGAFSGGSM